MSEEAGELDVQALLKVSEEAEELKEVSEEAGELGVSEEAGGLKEVSEEAGELKEVSEEAGELKEVSEEAGELKLQAPRHIGLFYFSLTGNTRFLATEICRGIVEAARAVGGSWAAVEVSCHDIVADRAGGDAARHAEMRRYESYDVLGFGSMTWAFHAPTHYKRLLSAVPEQCVRGKAVFVFSTHNGVPSTVISGPAAILRKKGAIVCGGLTVFAPENFAPWNPKKPLTEVWGSDDWERGYAFGRELVTEGRLLVKTPTSVAASHLGQLWSFAVVDFFSKNFVGKIKTDESICRGVDKCGLCIKKCFFGALSAPPAAASGSAVRFPVNGPASCVGCCRCVNLCPTNARNSWRTKGHAQYSFTRKRLVAGRTRKVSEDEFRSLGANEGPRTVLVRSQAAGGRQDS